MHRAILSSFASVSADGCVREPGPGAPLPRRSFWHFACAVLNAGAAGLVAAGMAKSAPPPALGSGKLGTPLARMHLANASGRCADGWCGRARTGATDGGCGGRCRGARATYRRRCRAGGASPASCHRTPLRSAAKASELCSRRAGQPFGRMLCGIWSPPGVFRVCASVLRDGGFANVSLLKTGSSERSARQGTEADAAGG